MKLTSTLIATLFIVLPTIGNAHTEYKCERTNLSTIGFKNMQAAESWYPKKAWVVEADDKSWISSTWGTKWNRNKNARKVPAAIVTVFGSPMQFRIFKDNKLSIHILSTTGFKHTHPTYYQCVKTTTSWKPSKGY